MKKIYAILVALVLVLSLTSCSKVSQKYADKVNKAAEAGEYYDIEKIRKDLGDEAVEVLFLNNGFVYAVKGCESWDEIEDKLDAGKTVKGLIITIANGKATAAKYDEIQPEE